MLNECYKNGMNEWISGIDEWMERKEKIMFIQLSNALTVYFHLPSVLPRWPGGIEIIIIWRD